MLLRSGKLGNSRGSTLIFVVSLAIILNIILVSIGLTVMKTQKFTGSNRTKTSSLLLAEAGKDKVFAELKNGTLKLAPKECRKFVSDSSLSIGTFTVTCRTNDSLDTFWIESWGKDGKSETGVSTIVTLVPEIEINIKGIESALTVKSNIEINGNIVIDGRDHYSNGNPNTEQSAVNVVAIRTPGTVTIKNENPNKVSVIGKGEGVSYSYGQNAIEKVVGDSLFKTPEEYLGLDSNSLNNIKKDTVNGKKFNNDGFNGIRYLTGISGTLNLDLGTSSGIIIVHNKNGDAKVSINANDKFKGIVIVDQMDMLNGNGKITGAVVALKEDSGTTKFGNGTAKILYSSEVLRNIMNHCKNLKYYFKEISWKELKR